MITGTVEDMQRVLQDLVGYLANTPHHNVMEAAAGRKVLAARATPANGEQVERDFIVTRTPTEDARERVKVLEEALDYAIEAVGKEADHAMHVTRATRWVVEEIEAKEARFKAARTALGNKETDRHG